MMARLDHLSAHPDETRALGAAALDVLLAEPAIDGSRVAAIGYCYGATIILELARSGIPLRAVVGFHPGLRTIRPEDARNITGRVLMFVGADDPIIPPEHRLEFEQEMRDGGVDWQLVLYGGVQHSFTHPLASQAGIPGIAYDQRVCHPQLASHGHPPRRRLLTKFGRSRPDSRRSGAFTDVRRRTNLGRRVRPPRCQRQSSGRSARGGTLRS